MSRFSERQDTMAVIYIHLMRDQSVKEILEDNAFVSEVSGFISHLDLGEEMIELAERVVDRKDIYGKAVDHYLTKWRFDRLGVIEQSILLMACAELEMGIQDKVIVVNEAVNLAKMFGDEDSFKLINGVVDSL